MSRKLLVYLSLVALALSGAPMLVGQPEKPADNPPLAGYSEPLTSSLAAPRPTDQAGERGGSRVGPITIVYDDGIVTAVPAVTSFTYGNQFNTASGDAVGSFSVTRLSFYMATGAGTDNVFVSVFGPVNTTAATASVLGSVSVPLNNGPGAFNTATIGPYAGAGSFLAGVWYAASDTVGLGTGTNNGQGHHGMVINDIIGTGFTQLTSLNALVGATTAYIPVELMDFKVTDE